MNKVIIVAVLVAVAAASVAVWYLTRPTLEVKEVFRDLTLYASMDKADFGSNNPVVVKVRLKNTSPSTPFDIAFNGSLYGNLRWQVAFYSENGKMVYNWTAHQPVKREVPLYIITMKPETEITQTITWDKKDDSGNKVPSGNYYVTISTLDFLYDYRIGYGELYVLQSGYNVLTFLRVENLRFNAG